MARTRTATLRPLKDYPNASTPPEEIMRNASNISPQRPRCDSIVKNGTVTYTKKTIEKVNGLYKKINTILYSLRRSLRRALGDTDIFQAPGGKVMNLRRSKVKNFVTERFAEMLRTSYYAPKVESIFDDLAWLSKYGCKVDTLAKNMVEALVKQVMDYSKQSKRVSTQRIESGGEKGKSSKSAQINIPVTTAIAKIIVSLAAQGIIAAHGTRYRT